jgi:hypothetical protein
VNILALNASVWYVPHYIERDETWGYLVQIDHLNAATGVKYTRVMQCGEMPKDKHEENENCTTIVTNVSFNFNLF